MRSVMILLITICLLAGSALALEETEPNDSMDDPQMIGEGTILGAVTNTGVGDPDIFKVDVPADVVVFYSIKKTDIGPGPIRVDVFDSERQRIIPEGVQDQGYEELTIAGEITRGLLVNKESVDSFFIAISGTGSFEVEVLFEETEDPYDAPGFEDEPDLLESGDELSGRVFELEYGYLEYSDVDRFEIPIDVDGIVTVKIKRTDPGNGTLYAGLDLDKDEKVEETSLTGIGDRATLEESVVSYYDEEMVYLVIWGEGEYEIEVNVEEDFPNERIMLGIFAGFMCFYMVILLLPLFSFVIIIILVIWLVTRGTREKNNVAKKRKKGRAPGKVPRGPPG